jgi:hypothetical protein
MIHSWRRLYTTSLLTFLLATTLCYSTTVADKIVYAKLRNRISSAEGDSFGYVSRCRYLTPEILSKVVWTSSTTIQLDLGRHQSKLMRFDGTQQGRSKRVPSICTSRTSYIRSKPHFLHGVQSYIHDVPEAFGGIRWVDPSTVGRKLQISPIHGAHRIHGSAASTRWLKDVHKIPETCPTRHGVRGKKTESADFLFTHGACKQETGDTTYEVSHVMVKKLTTFINISTTGRKSYRLFKTITFLYPISHFLRNGVRQVQPCCTYCGGRTRIY